VLSGGFGSGGPWGVTVTVVLCKTPFGGTTRVAMKSADAATPPLSLSIKPVGVPVLVPVFEPEPDPEPEPE